MKQFKCLALLFLFISAMAYAKPIPNYTAATVAGNYYNQTYSKTAQTVTLAYTERDADGQAVYYVFNINTNDGFVIVSAEDAGHAIIGSSDYGQYVVPTDNNTIGFWMNRRKSEIIAMRTANVQASSTITAEWNSYINNTPVNTHMAQSSVSPLLGPDGKGIRWNQSPYFNYLCPGSPSKSVTGCVATAMGQIMKYWQYPSVGIDSSCYYDEEPYYQENYGELCEQFDTCHYIWSEMPNFITSNNYQIARLLYDCGVSVDMDYSPSESSSYALGRSPSALNSYPAYFGYDASTIQGVIQSKYTPSAWSSLIKNELNNGRPVQYQGADSAYGGHSWVCDGYDVNGNFHMNWGWGGYDNGYFNPAALTPANTGYNFSYANVGAIIGIEPPPGALAVAQVPANQPSIKVYPNPGNGLFNLEITNLTGNPQISVYNVLGQQVYTATLTGTQTTLNLVAQPKGIYIYRVMSETGNPISTGKLVIE